MSSSVPLEQERTGALSRNDDFEKGNLPVHDDVRSFTSESTEAQAGVKRIEAVSTAWGNWSLAGAYIALMLLVNATSLEQNTTYLYLPFATSSYSQHSKIGLIYTVQSIVNACIKPTLAKISDCFGRAEGFTIAVFLYTLGYIQQAGASNVACLIAAQIFYSSGSQGLQILEQIFAADTTDLLNRALFSTIFDVPFLWTTWAGPELAQAVLAGTTWHWGYGMWAIILPAVFLPFAIIMFLNQRKAGKMGILPKSPLAGKGFAGSIKTLWYELDFFGLILLAFAISLILVAISLAPGAKNTWDNGSIIAMLVVGIVILLVFPFWERSKKLAPFPFFPPELFRSRTVCVGCAIGFFYFMAFYLSVYPYFSSYLIIVSGKSIKAAGRITQVFSFTSTVTSIIISFVIKYTAHYKYFVTLGGCIYLVGMGLMIRYREVGVSTGTLVGCQIAIGIGGGMLNVPAQLGVQASVSHQQVAAATAVFLTLVEIGGAVGNAISTAIWTTNIPGKLNQYLPAETRNQSLLIYGNITLASTGWPQGSPTDEAIHRAYQETMTTMLIVACCMAAPIIPLSLLMRNYKLNDMNQKVKGNVIGASDGDVNSTTTVRASVDAGKNHQIQDQTSASKGGFMNRFKKNSAPVA